LERIGKVLHIASDKNIILKAEKHAKIGDKVVDESLRPIGKIFDIFGPVSSPYISVKADTENLDSLTNRILYMIPSKSARKGKGKRR
jgi:rRNA processing protein Gar1